VALDDRFDRMNLEDAEEDAISLVGSALSRYRQDHSHPLLPPVVAAGDLEAVNLAFRKAVGALWVPASEYDADGIGQAVQHSVNNLLRRQP